MKNLFIAILCCVTLSSTQAQEKSTETIPKTKHFKKSLQAGAYFNQSTFSDNWKGGGVNNINWNTLFNGKTEYKKDKFDWSNDLQMQYGESNTKNIGVRKNFDRLFFESKASYKINGPLNAFGAVSFLTQFNNGYNYKKKVDGSDSLILVSGFMSPAYLTEAFGLEYKPKDYFGIQFGLFAPRQTFVTNQKLYDTTYTTATKLYGVDKGQYVRNQYTFQLVATFDKEIIKNITFKARYMFVIDYQQMNYKGIVSRLDASLVAKVNKYINVNFGNIVLYDYTQSGKAQYSQALGIGVLYSFSDFEDKK